MEKEKVIGVTLMVIGIIAICILGIGYSILNIKITFGRLLGTYFYIFLYFCSINLLMLREWPRKGVLAVCHLFSSLSFIPFYLFQKFHLDLFYFISVFIICSIGFHYFIRTKLKK